MIINDELPHNLYHNVFILAVECTVSPLMFTNADCIV